VINPSTSGPVQLIADGGLIEWASVSEIFLLLQISL
jgi:hypothetical protein